MAHPNNVVIRPIQGEIEEEACARIMAHSEPWITLGRTLERALEVVRDQTREVYVGMLDKEVAGFLVLNMRGAFVGYVQTVAVRSDLRGSGIGTRLIAFAERRIFRDTPNVFMCVSSFNGRARDLYERLGYTLVGELRDYLVGGHSEFLLRKSIAPLADFRRQVAAD